LISQSRKGKIVAFIVHLYNDAPVIHVFRKFVAATLALSLLLISSVPVASASACRMDGMQASDMAMSNLTMPDMSMQIEPISPLIDGQDCYIECGCRIDTHLDGMPHQLAPHALTLTASDAVHSVADADMTLLSTLIQRYIVSPSPPPKQG